MGAQDGVERALLAWAEPCYDWGVRYRQTFHLIEGHFRHVALRAIAQQNPRAAGLGFHLGNYLKATYTHRAALPIYEATLTLYHQVGAKLGEANVLQAIGDVQQFRDDRGAALASYEAALTLYHQVGAKLGEANVYAAKGELVLSSGDQPGADQLLAQAIAIYEAIGDRYSVPAMTGNFG